MTHPLLQPKTAAKYDEMFASIIALAPESKERAKGFIQWAKTTLKKQDRITWYLCWARLSLLSGLIANASTSNHAKLQQMYQKLRSEALAKYNASDESVDDDIRNWRKVQTDLQHYYSMGIAAIEQYIPKNETPYRLCMIFDDLESEALKELDENDRLLEARTDDEVFLKIDDRWSWWLLDRPYCTEEGEAMGHCGNRASYKSGDAILSLRELKRVAGRDNWEPHVTFILRSGGMLGEMKGRGNEKPAKRYHAAITALLCDHRIKAILGGGYAPENNFSISDLSGKERQRIKETNPDLATSLYSLYKKYGIDAIKETVEETTELEYTEGIGFVSDSWNSKDRMLGDLAYNQRKLTLDALDLLFEGISDGDPCLPNIVQSFINEYPGKRTQIEQYDPTDVASVQDLVWDIFEEHGMHSDTIERIVDDAVYTDDAIQAMFEKWQESHGSLESLTRSSGGETWYLYADVYPLLDAIDEGDRIELDWPTLDPEKLGDDSGHLGMSGQLRAIFKHPLSTTHHRQDRLYQEPRTDEEAREKGIHVSSVNAKLLRAPKTAFIFPREAELTVSIDLAARPKVMIGLDLGIPNFSRFAISVPVEDLDNTEIDWFTRQAFEALLQNVSAFLVSMKYAEELIVDVTSAAQAAFTDLDGEDASDAKMPDKDRSLRLYETGFELPEAFVQETHSKVVTAAAQNNTETPAFKAWFGASKVVDAKGRPERVFHATKGSFDAFQPGDIGTHVGTLPQAHSRLDNSVVKERPGGNNIIPLYARVSKPLVCSDAGNWDVPWDAFYTLNKALHGALTPLEKELRADLQAEGKACYSRWILRLRNELEKRGYDGIRYENEFEFEDDGELEDSWIVFNPNQLKSAIGNNGDFDPASNSITASVVRRSPDVRELVLTPIEELASNATPEHVIQFTFDQATKSTPRPFAVQVLTKAEIRRPARDWESRLRASW